MKGKLIGGSRDNHSKENHHESNLKVLCYNGNGIPAGYHNMHKLNDTNKLIEEANPELIMIMETGINENNKICMPGDNLEIVRENKAQTAAKNS